MGANPSNLNYSPLIIANENEKKNQTFSPDDEYSQENPHLIDWHRYEPTLENQHLIHEQDDVTGLDPSFWNPFAGDADLQYDDQGRPFFDSGGERQYIPEEYFTDFAAPEGSGLQHGTDFKKYDKKAQKKAKEAAKQQGLTVDPNAMSDWAKIGYMAGRGMEGKVGYGKGQWAPLKYGLGALGSAYNKLNAKIARDNTKIDDSPKETVPDSPLNPDYDKAAQAGDSHRYAIGISSPETLNRLRLPGQAMEDIPGAANPDHPNTRNTTNAYFKKKHAQNLEEQNVNAVDVASQKDSKWKPGKLLGNAWDNFNKKMGMRGDVNKAEDQFNTTEDQYNQLLEQIKAQDGYMNPGQKQAYSALEQQYNKQDAELQRLRRIEGGVKWL